MEPVYSPMQFYTILKREALRSTRPLRLQRQQYLLEFLPVDLTSSDYTPRVPHEQAIKASTERVCRA